MSNDSSKVIDCRTYNEIRRQMAQEAPSRPLRRVRAKQVLVGAVTPKDLRWLWPGRLPLGKMTVLDGDPGIGKSVLTLDLAARVSRGAPMPDGTRGDLKGPSGVLLLSVEDDPRDTIRPRLNAAGADVDRIALMRTVIDPPSLAPSRRGGRRPVTTDDIDALRNAIVQCKARLVIIDPLADFMPRGTHRYRVASQALVRLDRLASETGATVLVVRCGSESIRSSARYAGGSSIELLVAKDSKDATGRRRSLVVTKCNIAPETKPALPFCLEAGDNGTVRLAWDAA